MTYVDVMAALWTRATGVVDGARAALEVSLPTARGWVTCGKRPRAVWEEHDPRTGAWVVRPLYAIHWQTQPAIREVINTRGWSQVAGVQSIRFTYAAGLVVRMRDGRVIEVDDEAAAGGRAGA